MLDDTKITPTVKFDVGGKVFKTARSLILQHEDTMLARLVSDTWQEDPTKPVFIDRDGDTFRSVLDYLRYGSITLPMTVSKEMFLRDMDFYGIVHHEGTVKTSSEAWAAQIDNRHAKLKNLNDETNVLKEKIMDLELINCIDLLAAHCAGQYAVGTRRVKVFPPQENDKVKATKEKLWKAATQVNHDGKYKETFHGSLSKFGLRTGIVEKEYNGRSPDVYHITMASM
jgi:hypothetical protein